MGVVGGREGWEGGVGGGWGNSQMDYCSITSRRKNANGTKDASSTDVTLFFRVSFPLVYDTSSRETFEKLEEWLNEVEMYSTKKDIIKMLVGNKIDKVNLLRVVVL